MLNKVLEKKLPGVQKNILLKDYTTYRIGGPAKYFFIAKTKEDLAKAVGIAKELKFPIFILGGGSNILFSDKGFNGIVIKIKFSDLNFSGNDLFVGAGFDLTKLAHLSAEKNLSGLEWAAGVPGTIGGAIYGCAQAFGTKISDTVKSVDVLDIKTLEFKSFAKEQCQFALKNSIFKKKKNLIIVSAVLCFKKEDAEKIKNRIKEYLSYRKTNHPISFPSAGSTFVNPEIKIKNKKLLTKFPELNEFNQKPAIPAGYFISKSGLAGKKIGKAQISEKHANFILNLGGAKAKDILALIRLAQEKVKKNFGVNLEVEVQFVGFGKK